MKTLKSLKLTSIVQGIFILCGVLGLLLLDWMNLTVFKVIFYICLINPIGIVSFIVNMIFFITESKQEASFAAIGQKWIWIFIWPLINGALGAVYFLVNVMIF